MSLMGEAICANQVLITLWTDMNARVFVLSESQRERRFMILVSLQVESRSAKQPIEIQK